MNKRRKLLSVLLSLALILSLIPALGAPAKADGGAMGTEMLIDKTTDITNGLNLSEDTNITIMEGATLTVRGGIDASGHTLTVAGKGTLVVTGANGNNGKNASPPLGIYSGEAGGNGSVGINGNIIVTGGTVTVSGGNGGNGGYDETTGRAGGNGGNAIQGNVTVTGGSITVTGGKGGAGGTIGGGGNANNGSNGKAVTGTITGIAEESDNNSTWSAISGTTSNKRYVKVEPPHSHDFTYTASGATITATCSAEGCPLENGVATLTLKAPENLIADGKAKAATVEGEIPGVDTPEITYSPDTPTEEGSYTASITLEGATASIDFEITAPYYTITIPAKLDVANPGWNETAGISASGAIAEGTKLTVTAESANAWKLRSGDNAVSYILTDEEGGEQITAWEFTAEELAAENGTNKPMGAVVEEYINKPAGDYSDTVTFTASVAAVTKTITIELSGGEWDGEIALTYADGDTWQTIIDRNSTSLYKSGNEVHYGGGEGDEYNLTLNNNAVSVTDIINPTLNYRFVCTDI